MASETELERLVIRLMGDASHYKGVLNDVVRETNAAVGKIETKKEATTLLRQAALEEKRIAKERQVVASLIRDEEKRLVREQALAARQAAKEQATLARMLAREQIEANRKAVQEAKAIERERVTAARQFAKEQAVITRNRTQEEKAALKEAATLARNRAREEKDFIREIATAAKQTHRERLIEAKQFASEQSANLRKAAQEAKSQAKIIREASGITRSARGPEQVYSDTLSKLTGHYVEGRISLQTYNQAVDQAAATYKKATVDTTALKNSQRALREEQKAAREQTRLHGLMVKEAGRITQSVIPPLAHYTNQMNLLDKHLKAGTISQDTYNRAGKRAAGVYFEQVEASKEVAASIDHLGFAARDLGFGLTALGGILTAVFGSIVIQSAKAAGTFEQTTIAFETLLGSAQEGQATLRNLREFAAVTPFEMPEILEAARGLVAFGERGDELMETMTILGNAASANAADFGMVALVFNQIRGVGHLLTQDFRQLSTRGVLTLRDIAKHFGVTDAAAQKMITNSEVGFKDVREILKELSSEGGRYANMMERQSETLLGRFSTLKDEGGFALKDLGEAFMESSKGIVEWGITLTKAFVDTDIGTKRAIAGVVGLTAALGGLALAAGGVLLVVGPMLIMLKALGVTISLAVIGTMGWVAALIALAAAFGTAVGWLALQVPQIKDVFYPYLKDIDEVIAKTTKLDKLRNDRISGEHKKTLEEAPFIQARYGSEAAFQAQEKARKEVEGLTLQVGLAEAEVKRLGQTWQGFVPGSKLIKLANEDLEKHRAELAKTKQFELDLQAAMGGKIVKQVDGAAYNEDATKAAMKLQGQMKDQIVALQMEMQGYSKIEIKTFLAAQEGIPPALARTNEELSQQVEALQAQRDATKEAAKEAIRQAKEAERERQAAIKKSRDEINSFVTELYNSIQTFGMTTEEAKLFELTLKGMSPAAQEAARALIEVRNAQEAHKKAIEDGKKIMEEFATPSEKFKKRYGDLLNLWKVGAIDSGTFKRAVDDARKELADAKLEATITFNYGGVEGIDARNLREVRSRVMENFQNMQLDARATSQAYELAAGVVESRGPGGAKAEPAKTGIEMVNLGVKALAYLSQIAAIMEEDGASPDLTFEVMGLE